MSPVKVSRFVKAIEITGESSVIAGKSIKLSAAITPANATTSAVVWNSSDTSIATVSASGVVTAKKIKGQQTITITATAKDGGGASASWAITVTGAEQ